MAQAECKPTTRRDILKSAPAVIAVVALPGVALAGKEEDRELRRLWSDYLVAASVYMAASDVYEPAREAYDAIAAPDGKIAALRSSDTYCRDQLWEDMVEPASRAWNAADWQVRAAIKAIRATAAEGLVGVAIKIMAHLSRIDDDMDDIVDGLDAAQPDITRLTGLTSPWLEWEGSS